jgi:hypothetical protein
MTTVAGKNAREKHAPAKEATEQDAPEKGATEQADGAPHQARRTQVSSGNPHITVAFPFSRIDIREPSEVLRDLAALVEQLAEQVALIAGQVASDQADASDRLAAQAALLARRLRDTP